MVNASLGIYIGLSITGSSGARNQRCSVIQFYSLPRNSLGGKSTSGVGNPCASSKRISEGKSVKHANLASIN